MNIPSASATPAWIFSTERWPSGWYSGTMSPMLKEGIGMGYIAPEYAAPGTEIAVIIREKPVKAVVVKLPFL